MSQATLRTTGLPPNTEVGLFFVTARGNRMRPRWLELGECAAFECDDEVRRLTEHYPADPG